MWTDFVEVANDLPKKDRKLENDHYKVYVEQYKNRRGFGAVTRLMIVDKPAAPFKTRWADYQRIKDEVCSPDREGVEFYPTQSDLRDHGDGYHLWVLPKGKTFGLGFKTPDRSLNVYIDAGAHDGVTTQAALLSDKYDVVHAFEPDSNCLAHPRWADICAKYDKLNLIAAAVWTENKKLDWFSNPAKPGSQSGSVMREKTSGGIDTTEPAAQVQACDFSAWLKRSVRLIDNVHLKMDIEGAEFDVLEQMIETGAIKLIDSLTIEWHATKLAGDNWEQRKQKLITALRVTGVDVTKSKATDEQ